MKRPITALTLVLFWDWRTVSYDAHLHLYQDAWWHLRPKA